MRCVNLRYYDHPIIIKIIVWNADTYKSWKSQRKLNLQILRVIYAVTIIYMSLNNPKLWKFRSNLSFGKYKNFKLA